MSGSAAQLCCTPELPEPWGEGNPFLCSEVLVWRAAVIELEADLMKCY